MSTYARGILKVLAATMACAAVCLFAFTIAAEAEEMEPELRHLDQMK